MVDDFLESEEFRDALISFRGMASKDECGSFAGALKRLIRADGSAGWRPIDTAPKDGGEVWLYCPGDHPAQCAGFFSSDAGGRWEHCSKVLYDVAPEIFPTHWMPLPDAPKE